MCVTDVSEHLSVVAKPIKAYLIHGCLFFQFTSFENCNIYTVIVAVIPDKDNKVEYSNEPVIPISFEPP